MTTRGLAEADAARRVDAQNPQEEKTRVADVVLENAGSLNDLRARVDTAWKDVQAALH
jgi:dephospho-CoA kinase